MIDASRQALLDNQRATSDAPQSISNLTRQDAAVSSLGSLRLQDALGRGGGGGQEGEGGAVTPEQLRAAYSSEMVLKHKCLPPPPPLHYSLCR